jgi:predicted TIM-barrel fold metal-dependent hydrolase
MFERNTNFYADISARYAETAAIPRFVAQFYKKYSHRLLYGTDLGFDQSMYRLTFRFLETEDEHFYQMDEFNHHYPLHCFALPDEVLKRVYRENALAVFEQARNNATA